MPYKRVLYNTREEALAHYGVKGMQWGVRKNNYEGASRSTNREASKDAAEFARAKMFYGEGAGTRRKLIKAKVEAKAKKDPSYKKAFDHHLDQQDLGSHASKARSERRRKDVTSTTVKTTKGVYRSLTGGFGSVSMASAVLASGYMLAKQSGLDQVLKNTAQTKLRDMNDSNRRRKAEAFLRDAGLR